MNDQNMLNEGRKMKAAFQECFILRQPSTHGLLGRSLQIEKHPRFHLSQRERGACCHLSPLTAIQKDVFIQTK